MKIYFAHPMCTYNTILEEYFLEHFKQKGIEILNPNAPEHQLGAEREGMGYFERIVKSCDELFAIGFEDRTIGAGIAKEIEWMFEKGGKVMYFPITIGKYIESFPNSIKALSVDETRAKMKKYKTGTYKSRV